MSIGVEFVLKASTASFTRGLATIQNATDGLRRGLMKNFDGRDLARGLVTAFGLSVDKIADKFARLWTGVSKDAEEAYKRLGSLTDTLTEKTIEAGRAKLNDEQRYQLALTETARLQKQIAENAGKTTEDQIKLTEDKIALLEKEKEAAAAKAAMEKENSDREAKEIERQHKIQESVREAAEKERQEKKDLQRELDKNYQKGEDQLREKFSPSVEQLAQMSAGGFFAADDPRIIAKQILEKEKNAAILGGRGDISGAIQLGREARTMREGLQNVAGSGTALTAETAETALRNALDTTNKELMEVKTALAGIIKAQE